MICPMHEDAHWLLPAPLCPLYFSCPLPRLCGMRAWGTRVHVQVCVCVCAGRRGHAYPVPPPSALSKRPRCSVGPASQPSAASSSPPRRVRRLLPAARQLPWPLRPAKHRPTPPFAQNGSLVPRRRPLYHVMQHHLGFLCPSAPPSRYPTAVLSLAPTIAGATHSLSPVTGCQPRPPVCSTPAQRLGRVSHGAATACRRRCTGTARGAWHTALLHHSQR